MEAAEVLGPIVPQCASPLSNQENVDCELRLMVDTMTGGRFNLNVSSFLQIHSLKNLLAKKLNVLPDKICILHKDCVLSSGTLSENGLCDLSNIRVFLSMETGNKDLSGKKVGATNEAAVNQLSHFDNSNRPQSSQHQDFFKCVETKQFEEFLAGQIALTVAVKTENHTLLIQLKINSAVAGPHPSSTTKAPSKPGTTVDRLEQIAPGVVQGAFSGTIPICSSPQTGATYVPVNTVTDIVRDLVTYSAKAIGVPEVAASLANNADQCISCCGFTTPDGVPLPLSTTTNHHAISHQPQIQSAVSPGFNSNIPFHQKSVRGQDPLRKVESASKTQKASRLSPSSPSSSSSSSRQRRRKSSSSSSSCSSRRSSNSSDRLNEVTRMKMSLLRAMLSSK